jgi:hypothetical protein
MPLTLKYAANALVILGLVSTGRVIAQEEGASSAEQPPAASSLTGDQQSAATKALCSAIASNYKDAAKAGVSALTDPKVLLTAATSYSSVMHVSVMVVSVKWWKIVEATYQRVLQLVVSPFN